MQCPRIHASTPTQIEAERARFADAVAGASRQVSLLQRKARSLPGSAGEELGYLLDAYQQMLRGSRLVRGVDRRISEEQINAEAAVQHEIDQIVQGFAAMDDAYLAARIEDIREVGRRLVRNLTKTPYKPFSMLPKNAVILAEELTPADTALLDPANVAGFATVLGGGASHTAIMARSLGPAGRRRHGGRIGRRAWRRGGGDRRRGGQAHPQPVGRNPGLLPGQAG